MAATLFLGFTQLLSNYLRTQFIKCIIVRFKINIAISYHKIKGIKIMSLIITQKKISNIR